MTKLEELIVRIAQRGVDQMRFAIADPGAQEHFEKLAASMDVDWESAARDEQMQLFIEINTLVRLASLTDNGMADEAIAALKAIENEHNGLVRTASWMQPPPTTRD